MSASDTFYRYRPQNEGDHLADSQQVRGAKSGAQLDSENKVNGAGIFEEVDPDDFRREGYDQRAEEDQYEIDQANWRASDAERRCMEAEQARDMEGAAEAVGILVGLAVEYGVPFFKEKVAPWASEHVKPHIQQAVKTIGAKLPHGFARNRRPKEPTETLGRPERPHQEPIEMTHEEYDRVLAQAFSSAISLAAAASKLSAARIIDSPESDMPDIPAPKLAEKASGYVALHPELLDHFDQSAWERALFRKLEEQRNQAEPGLDPRRADGGAKGQPGSTAASA